MSIPKAEFMWHDGKLVAWDEYKIPFLTHSFHYGLAAFEGIRCYQTPNGPAIFRLREHMKRLLESAHIGMMEVPYTLDQLCAAAIEIVKANKQTSSYLRPVIYYGDEAMGLGAVNTVHFGIASFVWGSYLGEQGIKAGIRAKISSFRRAAVDAYPLKGKLNGAYINSILAKREALAGGYDEAILLDGAGYIAEASGENLFMVKDGELLTPPRSAAILEGITRDTIMKIAVDQKVPVSERAISRDMLYCADEVFLCGTAAEVTPVKEVDNRKIGSGTVGPITKELQASFFRAVRGEDSKYKAWLTPVV